MFTPPYPPLQPPPFGYPIYPPPPAPFPQPFIWPPYPPIVQPTETTSEPSDQPNPFLEASPLRAYLDTNYAPNASERDAVRDAIIRMQPEVDEAQKELARLREEIDRKTRQQALRIDFIEKHEALLTPIRHMPTEIVQEIFYQVLHANPTMIGSMHKDDAPMVLTRVCRSWREIALQTPRLWAYLHIVVPFDPVPGGTITASRIVGIEEWLRRSGSVPLHISIFQENNIRSPPSPDWNPTQVAAPPQSSSAEGDVDDPNDTPSMKKIVASIRSSVHRWSSLSLTIPFISLGPFVNIPSSDFAILREFIFSNSTPYQFVPHIMTEEFGKAGVFQTKLLSRLHLFHVPVPGAPLSYPINWSQLTHLSLDGNVQCTSLTPYLQLLERVQNCIESLNLVINILPPEEFPPAMIPDKAPTTLIRLPRLKTLRVQEQRTSCPILGESIRCPALEDLEYHEIAHWSRASHPGFYSDDEDTLIQVVPPQKIDGSLGTILSHSGVFVKTLTFDPHIYTNQDIIRYLSCVPNVETVKFSSRNRYPSRRSTTHGELLKAFVGRLTPNDQRVDDPSTPTSTFRTSSIFDGVLCPCVATIEWTSSSVCSRKDFVEFIELKQGGTLEGVSRLRRIMIHLDTPLSKEQSERLTEILPCEDRESLITCDPELPSTSPGSSIRAGLYIGPLIGSPGQWRGSRDV